MCTILQIHNTNEVVIALSIGLLVLTIALCFLYAWRKKGYKVFNANIMVILTKDRINLLTVLMCIAAVIVLIAEISIMGSKGVYYLGVVMIIIGMAILILETRTIPVNRTLFIIALILVAIGLVLVNSSPQQQETSNGSKVLAAPAMLFQEPKEEFPLFPIAVGMGTAGFLLGLIGRVLARIGQKKEVESDDYRRLKLISIVSYIFSVIAFASSILTLGFHYFLIS
jgi:hypothetical protein